MGRSAAAITVRTPDQAAILAAATFDDMPPLPRALPADPALDSSAWSNSTISSMSEASASMRGIGGEQTGRVGEQDQQVGAHEMRDERRQAVVVAEADLVVGDRVVLVDDRHDTELDQPFEGGSRVEVLLADAEVERREQHLSADDPVAFQQPVVDPHQPALSDGRHRLQGHRVTRAAMRRRDRGPADPAATAPDVTATTRWPGGRAAPRAPRRTGRSPPRRSRPRRR